MRRRIGLEGETIRKGCSHKLPTPKAKTEGLVATLRSWHNRPESLRDSVDVDVSPVRGDGHPLAIYHYVVLMVEVDINTGANA